MAPASRGGTSLSKSCCEILRRAYSRGRGGPTDARPAAQFSSRTWLSSTAGNGGPGRKSTSDGSEFVKLHDTLEARRPAASHAGDGVVGEPGGAAAAAAEMEDLNEPLSAIGRAQTLEDIEEKNMEKGRAGAEKPSGHRFSSLLMGIQGTVSGLQGTVIDIHGTVTETVARTSRSVRDVLDHTSTAMVTGVLGRRDDPPAPTTPQQQFLAYEDIKSLVKLTDWDDITAHSSNASEITLYVKGFLQEGDAPDKFIHWMNGHRLMCERRNWGPLAYGHHWQSGRRPSLTDFIPPVTSMLLLSRANPILKVPTPGTMAAATAATLAADAALIVWRFASQYYAAVSNSTAEARSLSVAINRLTDDYSKVRIVAHSLGCRHVIEAVNELPREQRPHEIHLLAPACRESDVEDKLASLATGPTYLYYCHRDYILATLFRTFSLGHALGQYGPSREYDDLVAVDVGSHFGFYVHNYYRQMFQEFLIHSAADPRYAGAAPGGAGPADLSS